MMIFGRIWRVLIHQVELSSRQARGSFSQKNTKAVKSSVADPLTRIFGDFVIKLLDAFTSYLTDHGVSLTELSRQESFAITKQWTSAFAAQSDGLQETQGLKAISKWLSTTDDELVLLFLSAKITAFPISENNRPCLAYKYTGPVIDLSSYNELEFAVFPDSYEWTLIHTHEDGAFGGPYFIHSEATP